MFSLVAAPMGQRFVFNWHASSRFVWENYESAAIPSRDSQHPAWKKSTFQIWFEANQPIWAQVQLARTKKIRTQWRHCPDDGWYLDYCLYWWRWRHSVTIVTQRLGRHLPRLSEIPGQIRDWPTSGWGLGKASCNPMRIILGEHVRCIKWEHADLKKIFDPITFTLMFELRHNLFSNVRTNVRKYVVTWLVHLRENNRRYPDNS